MKKKLWAVLCTLGLVLMLPMSSAGHATNPTHGMSPWAPAGGGGLHTIGVCLDASFYGPTTWSTTDPAHLRLKEAMATWNTIYGQQSFVTAGPGGWWPTCPSTNNRVIMYVKPAGTPPFTGGDTYIKGQAQHNHSTNCAGHWLSGSNQCNIDSSIYLNDYYWWYVLTGTPPSGTYDLESGLLHELGHTLGLADLSGCSVDAMCPLSVQQIRRTFGADDYVHVRHLYWDGTHH